MGLAVLSGNTLTLTGASTFGGPTVISGGTLQLGDGSGHDGSLSSTGTVTNNVALVFNLTGPQTYGGSISGTGSLTTLGTNALILTGSNTYTGPTLISAGTLQLGDGNGHDGSISAAGGIFDNSSLVYSLSGSRTYSGVISGGGSLTQAGTNVLILTGSNSYTGATTVSAGTLQLGNGTSGYDGSLASSSIAIANSSAALVYNISGSQTFSGNLTGMGSLTKIGNGTLCLSGTNNCGQTVVSGGTLVAAVPAALPHTSSTSALTVNSGGVVALNVGGSGWQSSDVGSLLTGGFAPGSLGIDTTSATTGFSYGNNLSGSMSLAKFGPNALTLSGTNTYSGNTIVSAGTLSVTSAGRFPAQQQCDHAGG